MKNKQLLIGLAVGFLIGSGLTFALSRHYVLHGVEATMFRLNTFTGDTWACGSMVAEWIPVKEHSGP